MSSKKEIIFDSIPGTREGETCLSIRPPGAWMDNKDFVVFVGGCGVGRSGVESEAVVILRREAISYCTRRIDEAEQQLAHYYTQRNKLRNIGLTGRRDIDEK
jgi:adenylate kinase